jgi:hypothetical protein
MFETKAITYISKNNKGKFIGEIVHKKMNGFGEFTYNDGRKHIGIFKNWKRMAMESSILQMELRMRVNGRKVKT